MLSKYCKIILMFLFIVCIFPTLYYLKVSDEKATQLKKVEYNKKIEVSGVIQDEKQTEISMAYPIYIKKCYVSENSYVNKGQLLFELDIERMKRYVKQYSLSSEYDENIFENSEIISISDKICSPESGFVSNISVKNSGIVMSGEPLCVIKDTERPILKISINQDEYPNIFVGDIVEFSPIVSKNKKYTARITDKTAVVRKESTITGGKTVIDIFAEIDCPDEYISSGLQFNGKIISPENRDIYTLPYEFINQDEVGEYTYIYQNGDIIKKYIKTGIEMESGAEILSKFDNDTIFVRDNSKGKIILEKNE